MSPPLPSADNLMRRPVIGGALVALCAVSLGCGVGDKDAHAARIRASRTAVAQASPVTGEVTFELELDRRAVAELESTQRDQLVAALAEGGKPTLTAKAVLDAKSRRAAVALDPANPDPSTLFADTELFARRRNARATERRVWARLDLEDVLDEERPIDTREMTATQVLTAVASTINPAYLVDLTEGALTGSVEARRPETVGDVEARRYDLNISLDKALTELDFDDEERETRLRLFRLLNASKDVVPARVWIDGEGRLRRLELELQQRVTRRRSNKLNIRVDLSGFGAQATLDPPAQDVTVTYERFGRLVRSVLPEEQ